jgi:DNA-binding NtrC family response regulator
MPTLIVCQDNQDYRVVEFTATVTIGRDQDNDIVLASPQISRHHASIAQRENGDYLLFDHDSTNGVWMDERKVHGCRMEHGSSFRIVNFSFTFVDEESDTQSPRVFPADRFQNADHEPMDSATILFNHDSGWPSLHPLLGPARPGVDQTPLERLGGLLLQLQTLDDEEVLAEQILSAAVTLAGAQRGFLALLNNKKELIYGATHNLNPRTASLDIRRDLIQQAMDGSCSILVRDNAPDKGKTPARSILCLPLLHQARVRGCLYLDHAESGIFATDDQYLLELLALHSMSLIDDLAGRQHLQREREALQSRLASKNETIVRSEKMLKLYEDIRTIAAINVPVFIQGEAGSGKEHIASALHSFSQRKGACVAVNCAAIPEGIFESELFGTRKGAYHEAADKPGKLELAEGGTLFLDEVADLALALQPKLLRFLENGEITRLGDTRSRKLDVRVVTATNRDVAAMIREGQFRDDLFQRLSCFTLKVPPLRERSEDIEPLCRYFLEKFAAEYHWQPSRLADSGLQLLARYPWPGNVRQLRNVLLRLAVQTQGRTITDKEVMASSEEFTTDNQVPLEVFPSLEEMEKNHLKAALERTEGNISDAAALLGIARSTFYQKMKKFNL